MIRFQRPALCLFRRATQIRGAATNVSKALEQGLLEDAGTLLIFNLLLLLFNS